MRTIQFAHKDIFFVVFGNMLGVGVFLTPYYVATEVISPTVYLLVWCLAAIGAITGGIVYASLAFHFPLNGGDFVFLSMFWNRRIAEIFFISMFLFAFPGTIAILSSGASLYTVKLFELINIHIANKQILLAIAFVFIFLVLNLNKTRLSILNQKWLVIFLLLLISIILIAVFFDLNFDFKISASTLPGTGNILKAILFAYFSFIGFASVAYIAGDVQKKGKSFFIPVVAAVVIIAIIYLCLNVVYILGMPWHVLQSEEASIFALLKSKSLILIATAYMLLILASLSSLNALYLTGGRLFAYIYPELFGDKKGNTSLYIFNKNIIIMSLFATIFLLTHTFGEILNTTTWVILVFSFLTSSGYLIHAFFKKLVLSYPEWIALIVFVIFSFLISLTGVVTFLKLFFKGFLYIITGFLVFYVLLFRKKENGQDAKTKR